MATMPASAIRLDYPVHTRVLDNGLRVVVSPDHSVPVVAVNLWYDVGSRDELTGETGWAHLFEHLMFQGSAHVASGEHLHLLQSVGGSVNATTWFDRTNYFETVPTGALDLALWLEADRLATLPAHLDDANVETQRAVVKEEKRQRYDNVPYGEAMIELAELTFPPGHPYAHVTIGSMADLDAATPERAAEFFRSHYRPDNAVLTLVGDIGAKDAFRRVEKAFGWIPGANRRRRPAAEPLPPLTGRPSRDLTTDVPSDAVHLAWRLPARDTPAFDAADLALAILGQGQTSRLHPGLVRGRAIAAGASAGAMGLIGGNSLGYASVRCLPGTTAAQVEEALTAEIDALLAGGPTPAELRRAKVQYEREWLAELAQLEVRADQLSAYATLHDDPGRVNRRLAELGDITLDDVALAAADLLGPDRAAVLRYHREAADVAS
jgi:predicted Zn-dependent peptidase